MTERYLRRSAEEWRALLERQSTSGLSQATFCHAEGLSLSSFQRWKRLLAEGKVTGPRRLKQEADSAASAPLFTALHVANDRDDEPSDAAQAWDIELDLGSGVCLRIRRGGGC